MRRLVEGAVRQERVDEVYAPSRQGSERLFALQALGALSVVIGLASGIESNRHLRRLDERVLEPPVPALSPLVLLDARSRLFLHGRDAPVGSQVVRVWEAADVADLGGDRRPVDATDAGNALQDRRLP